MAYLGHSLPDMGNPYRDVARLATEPAAVGEFPTLVEGDQRLLGLEVAYAPGPLPITLRPGHEYRIRQVRGEDVDHWIIESRRT